MERSFHNLSSWNFHNRKHYDEKIEFIPLTPEKIPNDLPELLQTELLSFDQYFCKKFNGGSRVKYGYLANLTTGDVDDYFTSGSEINVSFKLSKIKVRPNDVLIATHSHSSCMPFNYKDFKAFFVSPVVYMKYMVVHTPEDIFIAKFNQNAIENKKTIMNFVEKEFTDMMGRNMKFQSEAFGIEALWDNYLKNEILNKYISFRRISK